MIETSKQVKAGRPARGDAQSRRRAPAAALVFLASAVCLRMAAAEIDASKLPPPADAKVDFDRDIKPVFEKACWRCHGPEKPKSRFRLDNRESALKGGNNNADDIVPGNSRESKLIHYTARLVEDLEMPPSGKGEPLTPAQVGLLRAWIDQGANWGAANPLACPSFSISPTLRWISVSGDNKQFRELEGIREGWAGGVEHFALTEALGHDKKFSVEGRALFGEEDYQLKLALEKTDFGFARAGFESWRKYYDDSGGFAPLLPTNSYSLNRDLHLDTGRAWLDLGLTLPDWPQVVVGYEYQFKEGEKSTLQWGPVGTMPLFPSPTDAKNVYPAFKQINEDTHIIKVDVSHELGGWRLEDSARVEFYSLETSRQNLTGFPAPDTTVRVDERHEHTQGANTFNVSKQIKEWLSVSSGYLYSRLEGDAALKQNTFNGSGMYVGGDQWLANNITLRRESQVVSLGSLVGPWAGLTLSAGAQGEWTRQEGMGYEDLRIGNPSVPAFFSDPSIVSSQLDGASARENVLLRFVKIPWTVVFAEARLRQESLGRSEQRPDGSEPFTSDTDADIESQEYRAGFNTSPWSWFSLSATYKDNLRHTDYTHLELFNPSGHVYPGFLLWRDIEDNQFETRLVLRPASWLKTSFNYRIQETDFNSATAAVTDLTPGGPISAGNYEAQVYSLNAVLTPFRQLYFSGTLTYSDTRTRTEQNGDPSVVPYEGDVYNLIASANYVLNKTTDLHAAYLFTRADYAQNNGAEGLPLGMDFVRHGFMVAMNKRLSSRLTTHLQYTFYRYWEPQHGEVNEYTAHGVFATVAVAWP